MGLADLIKFNTVLIESVDSAVVLSLELPYQPDGGIEVGAPPTLSQSSTAGTSAPAVQWVAQGADTCRLRSSLRSTHVLDDIRGNYDKLRALDRYDGTLGRAPRVRLTWGEYEIEGFASVRATILGWWPVTSLPRQVDFEIEITAAPELLIANGGGGNGETSYRALVAGETFELLALRAYGDPLKGDLLRRINPDSVDPGEGELVRIVEREHDDVQGRPYPSSPPFMDRKRKGNTWGPVLADLLADRGTDTEGVPWALQPLLAEV